MDTQKIEKWKSNLSQENKYKYLDIQNLLNICSEFWRDNIGHVTRELWAYKLMDYDIKLLTMAVNKLMDDPEIRFMPKPAVIKQRAKELRRLEPQTEYKAHNEQYNGKTNHEFFQIIKRKMTIGEEIKISDLPENLQIRYYTFKCRTCRDFGEILINKVKNGVKTEQHLNCNCESKHKAFNKVQYDPLIHKSPEYEIDFTYLTFKI